MTEPRLVFTIKAELDGNEVAIGEYDSLESLEEDLYKFENVEKAYKEGDFDDKS